MRRYVRGNIERAELFSELETLQNKLQNKYLKNKYKTKKHILKALSGDKFKRPYKAKWWKEYRKQELERYMRNKTNLRCPECGTEVASPTLQHIWHPRPFRVLCTETIGDKEFESLIPDYIEIQNEKKGLNKKAYRKWCWWEKKCSPSYKDEEIVAFGYCKARSNYALGYFSPDELLLRHIDEVKRHLSMDCKDYKYICSDCACKEDQEIIQTGRLVWDVPYFLLDESCKKRDTLAQAFIDELANNL